jgi:3-phosphoshikimate 1-carboxyvinyltransferase
MMPREIRPALHTLDATVRVPGSKSLTNRALLVASLADGETRITNALFSDDSLYFASALLALGLGLQLNEARNEMMVSGAGGAIPNQTAELSIGNAGTAARFLTALLTLGHGSYALDGNARMRERPIGDLASALEQLGAHIETTSGYPPVKITASGLPGGRTRVAGEISSQFLSALLMVAPYGRRPVEIELSTDLNSRPYVELTLAVMRDFGVEVEREGAARFCIQPARYWARENYEVESDASSASYFFAAAAIRGGSVRVSGMRRTSRQGDLRFVKVLEQMGCAVIEAPDEVGMMGGDSLHGVDIDLSNAPDTAQTLAVVAPFAATATRIRGIASARLKETDRIHATCTELRRLGVRVEEHTDGMTIHPCKAMNPGHIHTYDDHRMAMAFSLIGLRVPGIFIENPACVSKTFPGFFEVLESLQ